MTIPRLEIAGVRFELRGVGDPRAIAERFGAFCAGSGPARWRFDVLPGSPPRRPVSGRLLVRGGAVLVEGAEELGWLDRVARRAEVRSDPVGIPLEPLLRAALATDLLAQGGCLVHASAVVVDGLAHLFPGRSGSGKSTFAALASHALADELSVVLPGPGGFRVHGTPWWRGRPESAPLARVYEIGWDGEAVRPLRSARALRHLVGNLVLPVDGPAEAARAFDLASRVAAAVPFARLSFRPGSNVDAIVRAGLAARAA